MNEPMNTQHVIDALGGEGSLSQLVEGVRIAVEERAMGALKSQVEDTDNMDCNGYIVRDLVARTLCERLRAIGFDARVNRQGKSSWHYLLATKEGVRLTAAKVDKGGRRPRGCPFRDTFNPNGQYELEIVDGFLTVQEPDRNIVNAIITYSTSSPLGSKGAQALSSIGLLLPGVTEDSDVYASLSHLVRRDKLAAAPVESPVIKVKKQAVRRVSGDEL